MANTDINPYGQGATMPSGYPIADNLTTNSAQQALSAKQGKRLGDYLFDQEEAVSTSSLTEQTGWITAYGTGQYDNKWTANSAYGYMLVPVTEGTYRLTANAGCKAYYTVLASAEGAGQHAQTPDFATGYDRVKNVEAGETEQFDVPADGVYLYIGTNKDGTDATPEINEVTSQAGINEFLGEKIGETVEPHAKPCIVVAASDAPTWQKANADYVCDGVNDELTIQQAIDSLSATGGRIRLTAGTFVIDSFPNDRKNGNVTYTDSEAGDSHRYAAVMIPQNGKSYTIEGDTFSLRQSNGTILRVSDTLYSSLGPSDLRVVFAAQFPSSSASQINNNVGLEMKNIAIAIPWNQKPIMCIDCLFTGRVYLQFIRLFGYISNSVPSNNTTVDNNNPPPKAVAHCVGLRTVGGSNWGTCNDYKNICASGFYEGFKVSGEHTVGVNLSAIHCVYGYTFGNFTYTGGAIHPITLFNCCDEQNYYGPYFALTTGPQAVYIYGFNMEIGQSYAPGGEGRGGMATEKIAGTWRGEIRYTICAGDSLSSPACTWKNYVNKRLWEDGHGHGIISRNMAHLQACTSSVRNTYTPDYLERIWDTTLGKEVTCVDETNNVWKDAMGNTV